ncbi:MAG: nucleoside hydrolase, partial [Dongiaceae bacterium]
QCRPLITATVHGETGLDGADLPAPTMPLQPSHAVDWLVDTVMSAPDRSLTLCALGPLTNVAAALQREPRLAARLCEIVVMGGAGPEAGNVTPDAEFNVHVDPEAADAVFRSGGRLVVVPLDLTRQVVMTEPRYERMCAFAGPVGRAAAGMVGFYNGYATGRPDRELDPLHDPCVIAWLLAPQLFAGEPVRLVVETHEEARLGMTRMNGKGVANCTVLCRVDADGFYDLLLERLARL